MAEGTGNTQPSPEKLLECWELAWPTASMPACFFLGTPPSPGAVFGLPDHPYQPLIASQPFRASLSSSLPRCHLALLVAEPFFPNTTSFPCRAGSGGPEQSFGATPSPPTQHRDLVSPAPSPHVEVHAC